MSMEIFPCSVCDRDCDLGTIWCSQCKKWGHGLCSNLTDKNVSEWSKRTLSFVCKACAFNKIDGYSCDAALIRTSSMRKCPVCEMSGFDTIDDLRDHRRTDHAERVATCSCGRSFLEYSYMQQHLRDLGDRHGMQKTSKRRRNKNKVRERKPRARKTSGAHSCTFCDRSFGSVNGLNSHTKAKHPGEGSSSGRMSGNNALINAMSSMNLWTRPTNPMPAAVYSTHDYSMPTRQNLPTDLYDVDSSDLDKFIAERIQPDDSSLTQCGLVVNEMADYLKGPDSPFKPGEIIKSGSLGKGTSVKGNSDVDLIVMLNDHPDVETHMRELPDILKRLEDFIKEKTRAQHTKTTRFSVQAKMRCNGDWLEVDILPAVDLIGRKTSLRDIYNRMKTAESSLIHEYSVTLSPLQLEIIKYIPTKVKSLIRLVKYWRNNKLKGSSGPSFVSSPAWPNSYSLELIILNCWVRAGKPHYFDMTRAVHSVLKALVNHKDFAIRLPEYCTYDPGMAQPPNGRPYIMDPTNPFNDLYHGLPNGKAFDWAPTATKASQWLNKSLFSGVLNTENQWL